MAGQPDVPGYEILAELGSGGMGVVYLARQVRANRLVALKMVRAGEHCRQEDLLRFRLEGESLARLQHPNVVQVYELGVFEGRPFFSMEYVDGGTLAASLAKSPRAPEQAAALIETIARAVHAAHQCGVIHRDLKPANILLTATPVGDDSDGAVRADSAVGIPKVMDFGLAKILGSDDGLTRTGQTMGTPSYMAPEQATGDASVGVAADVYALGAILYELLSGRPPFRAASPWETMMQVVHEAPQPPSKWRPGLARDLEVVCLKCLTKEPKGRYPSADALAEDLRRFLNGEPVAARRVGPIARTQRWCRRHPAIAGLMVALTGALVFGLAAVTALWLRADRLYEQAENRRSEANQLRLIAERRRLEADARGEELQREKEVERHNSYLAQISLAALNWSDHRGLRRMAETLDRAVPKNDETDLRGWEWFYLKGRFFPSVKTFNSGGRQFSAVAWSPDGARLAAGAGKDVLVWHLGGGKKRLDLTGHTDDPNSLSWSSDSNRLLSASPDGTVRLWSFNGDRVESKTFAIGAKRRLLPDRLRPGGKAGSPWQAADNTVRIWDVEIGRELTEQSWKTEGNVWNLAWSPDGTRVATIEEKGRLRVHEIGSARPDRLLQRTPEDLFGIAWSHDGRWIASGGWDSLINIWDADKGNRIGTLRGHGHQVLSVAFSPDDSKLASVGDDGMVKIWDLAERIELSTWRFKSDPPALSWANDNRQVALAGGEVLTLWNIKERGWYTSLSRSSQRDPSPRVVFLRRASGDRRPRRTNPRSRPGGQVDDEDLAGPSPRHSGTRMVAARTSARLDGCRRHGANLGPDPRRRACRTDRGTRNEGPRSGPRRLGRRSRLVAHRRPSRRDRPARRGAHL